MANDPATLVAELERLYQRQADLRAHEVDLADRGENDPASDEWKLAAVAASGAEADFRSALVRNYSTISRVLREAAEGCDEGQGLPIDAAPESGTFLAFNPRLGEFCEVQRYDHPDGSKNCVINARMGRWWRTDLWYPLPPPPATETTNSQEPRNDL